MKLKKQKFLNSNYYKQRKKEDSFFDFKNLSFRKANGFVKALQKPYPNAFFYKENKKIEVERIKASNLKLKPGTIFFKNKKLFLGCRNNTIEIIKYSSVKY